MRCFQQREFLGQRRDALRKKSQEGLWLSQEEHERRHSDGLEGTHGGDNTTPTNDHLGGSRNIWVVLCRGRANQMSDKRSGWQPW